MAACTHEHNSLGQSKMAMSLEPMGPAPWWLDLRYNKFLPISIYVFHMVGKDAGVWCSTTLFQLSIDTLVQHPYILTSQDVSSLPESIATQLLEGMYHLDSTVGLE